MKKSLHVKYCNFAIATFTNLLLLPGGIAIRHVCYLVGSFVGVFAGVFMNVFVR